MSPRFAESCREYFVGNGRAREDQGTADDHRWRNRLGEEDKGPYHGEEGDQVGHGQSFAGADVLNQAEVKDVGDGCGEDSQRQRYQ